MFSVEHRPVKQHHKVDSLSRLHCRVAHSASDTCKSKCGEGEGGYIQDATYGSWMGDIIHHCLLMVPLTESSRDILVLRVFYPCGDAG